MTLAGEAVRASPVRFIADEGRRARQAASGQDALARRAVVEMDMRCRFADVGNDLDVGLNVTARVMMPPVRLGDHRTSGQTSQQRREHD